MAHELNTVDEFLKHKATERSGAYLKNWKNRNPPTIDVFLYMKRMPIVLWQHGGIPRIIIREDKQTRIVKKEIWGGQWNCREDEPTLKKQYHRRDDGTRKYPPTKCPICRLVEIVRDMVEEGQMDWLTPIFRFEGDEDTQVIHAGGLFGLFNRDDLSPEEKAQMKAAGLSPRDTWMENGYAKCNYVFSVVDVSDVAAGLQTAICTALLGDKVKDVINDKMRSDGSEAGNPWLNPYCIQWEYLEQEVEFSKRYKARPMNMIKCTEAIGKIITGEPPDLANVVAPYDRVTMRSYLERHCLVKNLDWEYIFNVPDDENEGEAKVVGEFPPEATPSDSERPRAALPAGQQQAVDPADICPECHKTEATGCLHAMCDACDKIILASDPKCKHCGKVFDAAAVAPPPPPPPASPRRRRVAKETGDTIPFARK